MSASSFHLWLPNAPAPYDSVSVDLTILANPNGPELRYWALQMSFVDQYDEVVGTGHVGLQWFSAHPNNRAVNWGGYYTDGGFELNGGRSELPSAPNNPNTRDFNYVVGRRYRLHVFRSPKQDYTAGETTQGIAQQPAEVAYRATIVDQFGSQTIIRDLFLPIGTQLKAMTSAVVWTEDFNDPSVSGSVRWSNPLLGTFRPQTASVNYGPGATNTNSSSDQLGIVQETGGTRFTPQGATLTFGGGITPLEIPLFGESGVQQITLPEWDEVSLIWMSPGAGLVFVDLEPPGGVKYGDGGPELGTYGFMDRVTGQRFSYWNTQGSWDRGSHWGRSVFSPNPGNSIAFEAYAQTAGTYTIRWGPAVQAEVVWGSWLNATIPTIPFDQRGIVLHTDWSWMSQYGDARMVGDHLTGFACLQPKSFNDHDYGYPKQGQAIADSGVPGGACRDSELGKCGGAGDAGAGTTAILTSAAGGGESNRFASVMWNCAQSSIPWSTPMCALGINYFDEQWQESTLCGLVVFLPDPRIWTKERGPAWAIQGNGPLEYSNGTGRLTYQNMRLVVPGRHTREWFMSDAFSEGNQQRADHGHGTTVNLYNANGLGKFYHSPSYSPGQIPRLEGYQKPSDLQALDVWAPIREITATTGQTPFSDDVIPLDYDTHDWAYGNTLWWDNADPLRPRTGPYAELIVAQERQRTGENWNYSPPPSGSITRISQLYSRYQLGTARLEYEVDPLQYRLGDYIEPKIEYNQAVPPLRQAQRNDVLRPDSARVTTKAASQQRSQRQGWGNAYL